MNSKIVIPVIIVIAAIFSVFYFKSFNTSNPVENPQTQAEGNYTDWQTRTFNEAGLSLSFKIPPDTTFRKEIADDGGRIRVASFYIEKGAKDNPDYQLYAVYQPLEEVAEQDLEKVKTGMDPASIKNTTIDGYKGIEGWLIFLIQKPITQPSSLKMEKCFLYLRGHQHQKIKR